MKFNGATFNKAQQDQLKKKVGAELEDVIAKASLNKYTYSFTYYNQDNCKRLYRICGTAKGKILLRINNAPCYISKQYDDDLIIVSIDMGVSPSAQLVITQLEVNSNASVTGFMTFIESNSFGVSKVGSEKLTSVEVIYYNDTEIL